MTQFMGTHTSRIDAKGRVSIPAPFRAALRLINETAEMVLRPSHRHGCIEGWPKAAFDELAKPMQRLDTFSDDEDDLAYTIYAESAAAKPDPEGRLVLAADLSRHAHLVDAVAFVGLGRKFEIWEPAALAIRRGEALARTRARNLTLPAAAP